MKLPANFTGRLFAVVAASIGLYSLLAIATGWGEFRQQLAAFPLRYVAPLLILSGVNYLLRYWRWELFLRKTGVQLSCRQSLIIFFATFVMVITPGKLGEAFKAGILWERHRISLAIGIPVIIAERVFDFLAIFLLAMLGFLGWQGSYSGIHMVLFMCLVIVALLFLLRTDRLWQFLLRRASSAPYLSRYSLVFSEALGVFKLLLQGRTLVISLLVSVAAWLAECISLWLVCSGSQATIGLVESVFIYSSATLAGSLTFLPGGLGGTELTLIGLLKMIDIPANAAVSISFIVRLATLWLAVLIGLVVFLGARKQFLNRHPAKDCDSVTDKIS
jgi:uncharacterized protein (TIRG00374 family)